VGLAGGDGVIGLHLLGFYGVSVWRFGLDSGFAGGDGVIGLCVIGTAAFRHWRFGLGWGVAGGRVTTSKGDVSDLG